MKKISSPSTTIPQIIQSLRKLIVSEKKLEFFKILEKKTRQTVEKIYAKQVNHENILKQGWKS